MDMYPTYQRPKASPRALVGKILFINGIVFIGVSVLLGGYALFSQTGTTSAQGNSTSAVMGLLALIFAGVGLVEGLVGLLLWLIPGGESPSASVVNQYFAALKNQDYGTAFQYLNLSMEGPWSQTLTQTEFIERANAYDAEHGIITNYSLRGVQANPSRRVYTFRVTRSSGVYTTKLRLAKQGYDWKIVGFDRF